MAIKKTGAGASAKTAPIRKEPRKPKPPLEKVVHQQVCTYLDLQYPDIIYQSDPSGARVTQGLRVEFARKCCKRYKVLDLTIMHPSKGCHGLVIEIKRDGEKLFKKDGTFVSEHVQEQAKTIDRLNSLGYYATFGIGFDECKGIIDNYLK